VNFAERLLTIEGCFYALLWRVHDIHIKNGARRRKSMHVVTSHMKKVSGCLICLFIVLILLSSCEFLEFLDSIVTVTYDSNGGTPVSSKTTRIGEYLEKPSSPSRDDHRFKGWYLENKKWDFDRDKIQKDMTLVAQWIPNNPANWDYIAAWQLLKGTTWTNGVYTITFTGSDYISWCSWSGYGSTGYSDLVWGPYFDGARSSIYIMAYPNMLPTKADVVFSKDGKTMEIIDQYIINTYANKWGLTWFPPGTWTKVESE